MITRGTSVYSTRYVYILASILWNIVTRIRLLFEVMGNKTKVSAEKLETNIDSLIKLKIWKPHINNVLLFTDVAFGVQVNVKETINRHIVFFSLQWRSIRAVVMTLLLRIVYCKTY